MFKRHCILILRQRARASTGPDTLFDASEATADHPAQALALACGSLLATVHACIVRSFSARSRRYAGRSQRCTREQEQATLARSMLCANHHKQARHRKQARRQSRLTLRAPRTRSQARDDAAPAQRSLGRKLEETAPDPAPLENHLPKLRGFRNSEVRMEIAGYLGVRPAVELGLLRAARDALAALP